MEARTSGTLTDRPAPGRAPFPDREGYPSWLARIGRVFDWLFPLLAVVVIAPSLNPCRAHADAGTVPARQASLRELLGYAPGEAFRFDNGKWGVGEIELSVDDRIGLPNVPTGGLMTRATAVRLMVQTVNGEALSMKTGSGSFPTLSQVYQWTSTDPATWLTAMFPPCVSPDQTERALEAGLPIYGGDYQCLTEEDLVLVAERVIGMSVWERADWPMVLRLQDLHGSAGVPVVVGVGPAMRVEDARDSPLASTLRWWALYQFVLPAPGSPFVVPSVADLP